MKGANNDTQFLSWKRDSLRPTLAQIFEEVESIHVANDVALLQ